MAPSLVYNGRFEQFSDMLETFRKEALGVIDLKDNPAAMDSAAGTFLDKNGSISVELGRTAMVDFKNLRAELRHKRDEIKLQLHLGSMEAEQEWEILVSDWDKFLSVSQFEQTAEEVGEAARDLGLKMKTTYDRAKEAVG
jgi:hypothetical protein